MCFGVFFANVYNFRTKGIFPKCSVFNAESINMNLDGQLLCEATDKAQMCPG